jgi:ribosomal protein S12 methylthiotransferase
MKTYIVSMGCPKNTVDTEAAIGLLQSAGCTIVGDPEEAELLIVNACSFLDSAWRETVEEVEHLTHVKQAAPTAKKLVLMGCLPLHKKEGWRDSLPGVDRFVPSGGHSLLPSIVDSLRKGRDDSGWVESKGLDRFAGFESRVRTTPNHIAYVKIAEGCSRTCTFCAIPRIRGEMVSRTIEAIVREVKTLRGEGVREVSLLAQDITSYRDGHRRLPDLVDAIVGTGVEWVRLFYVHPGSLTVDLARRFFEHPSVCRYLEVPVQHASDRMLRLMGRQHTRAHLDRVLGGIREEFPDAVVRSEVIVGFPGESDEDFSELKSFIESVRFASLGVFVYSAEEGTAAATREEKVVAAVCSERAAEIADIQNSITFGLLSSERGRRQRVLVDRRIEKEPGARAGFSHAGRYYGQAYEIDGEVYLKGRGLAEGDFVMARITDADAFDLEAEVDEPQSP